MQKQIKIYNVARFNHRQSFKLKSHAIQYSLYLMIKQLNVHLNWLESFITFNSFENTEHINVINLFVNSYNDNKYEEAYEIIHDFLKVYIIDGYINENLTLNQIDIKIPKINLEALNTINKIMIFK